MPAHERAALANQLSVAVAELALAGIRFDHPEASIDEVRHELARRRYGRELADEMNPPRQRQ